MLERSLGRDHPVSVSRPVNINTSTMSTSQAWRNTTHGNGQPEIFPGNSLYFWIIDTTVYYITNLKVTIDPKLVSTDTMCLNICMYIVTYITINLNIKQDVPALNY